MKNKSRLSRALWRTCLALPLALAGCQSGPATTADAPPPPAGQVLTTESDSAFQAVEDLDRGDRENWQKPQMVISRLGDLSDKVVADIGAGTGYFSIPLARKAQKVIAIDIEQQFLDYIHRRLKNSSDRKSLNIETRLTTPDNPNLGPTEVDLVLIVNTYAYIDGRVDYFKKVHAGLKPAGRLVVIDFKKEPLPVGPAPEFKLDAQQVSAELDSAGFRTLSVDYTSLDYQYTITAERRNE